jgi:hypothetical protein
VGVGWALHQLVNASDVESKVVTPQFRVVVAFVVVELTPGPLGLKLLGTYGNVAVQADPTCSHPLAVFASQLLNPLLQVPMAHAPSEQVALALVNAQTAPQPPQFARLVSVLVSQPSVATELQFP